MRRRRLVLSAAAAFMAGGIEPAAAASAGGLSVSPAPGPAALGDWVARFDDAAGELVIAERPAAAASGGGTSRAERPPRRLPAASLDGRTRARAAEILPWPGRRSFVVVFDGLPELWEISVDRDAPPVFDGLVHDYRMGEGIALGGFLNPRRTRLARALRAPGVADAARALVVAREREAPAPGRVRLCFVQLDIRRVVRTVDVDGDPDTAAATVDVDGDRRHVRLPLRDSGRTLTVDPWR